MKTTILKTALYITTLLLFATCDTKEDAFWAGTKPSGLISTDKSEIYIDVDGNEQNVNVTARCNWEASLTENGNHFSISSTSGEGNGTIIIKANPNYAGTENRSTQLIIKVKNFDEQITVNVKQLTLAFEMQEKEYPVVGEEGGDVDISFNSTTAWKIEARPNSADPDDIGDINWLTFTPRSEGAGETAEIMLKAIWKPNYSLAERSIKLALTPVSDDVKKQHGEKTFTLRQAAGTLPAIGTGKVLALTESTVSYQFSYKSKSSVSECGVRVLTSSGEEVKKVSANANNADGTYALEGDVLTEVTGLDKGTDYTIVPYMINKVGESSGQPENILTGIRITGYTVTPNGKSVTVEVTAESGVNVSLAGIDIYNADYPETPYEVTAEAPASATACTISITSAEVLTPNTESELVIFVRNSNGEEARTERIKFTTTGLIPDEEDNNRPDIQ